MSDDSMFSKLLGIIRDEGSAYNPSSLLLAEIESAEPFILKIGKLNIDKDNILIADYLLDYERDVNINNDVYKYKFLATLNKGDRVAVMPIQNNQLFIILCKVVSI